MTGEHSTRDPRSAAPVVLPPRLAVRSGDRLVLVNVGEIDWIEANDNYVTIWRGTETLTMRGPLKGLENRLSTHGFFRISRSVLVNLERVRELRRLLPWRYRVLLKDGRQLKVTRGCVREAKHLLETLL